MALKNTKSQDKYVMILSNGTMRVTVPEGTEGAVKRDYETSDGKKGTKFELVYTELSGVITKINFFEGDYGKLLQLTVKDEDDEIVTLSVSTSTPFGEDLMKKLPNIKIDETVTFAPYSFKDEKEKNKRGVTVYQDEEKISNYFFDSKKKENIHDYPEPKFKKGKKISKEEWKLYFGTARLFLIDFITEHFDIQEEKPKKSSVKKEDGDEDEDW